LACVTERVRVHRRRCARRHPDGGGIARVWKIAKEKRAFLMPRQVEIVLALHKFFQHPIENAF
jgi:hypothetical protein